MSWENYFNHNVKIFYFILFIIQPCYRVILNYNEKQKYIWVTGNIFLWTYLGNLDTGMFFAEFY